MVHDDTSYDHHMFVDGGARCHFESLAQYQHLPAPLVRALGAAKAVLLHISGVEERNMEDL